MTLKSKVSFPLTKKKLLSPLQCKLKQNFVFALLKLILNFFSGKPKLPLMPNVGPSPNIKKLFLRLSVNYKKLQHF